MARRLEALSRIQGKATSKHNMETLNAEMMDDKDNSTEILRIPAILPLLPVREQVNFPHSLIPLMVGREMSILALEEANAQNKYVLIVAQKDSGIEDPKPEDLFEVGVVAKALQTLQIQDGTVRTMMKGIARFKIERYIQRSPYYRVEVKPLPLDEEISLDIETTALMRTVIALFEAIVSINKSIQPEALITVMNCDNPGRLADTIVPYLRQLRIADQQDILETLNSRERLRKVCSLLKQEMEILEVQQDIRARVERGMGQSQKEYFLREQMKVIQQELGEIDAEPEEAEVYRSQIHASGMNAETKERALREVSRLERMPFIAPEASILRNYLDWLIALPWSKATEDALDIEASANILEEDHFGLEKVKERILEFLAVRKLTGTTNGSILCFVGPPGVGKTSIGRSIARALGRKFHRVSLGGVRDEAEIRGHRRTYVGAMPGRIIQGIRNCGVKNPVFMLDEIDKLSSDYRGDPSSALLEALDPEQNREFSDHYIELAFDLSDVFFILTANLLETIPPALRDRMEVIRFTSYTEQEKHAIAKKFLAPRQRRENGLGENHIQFGDDSLLCIIREYTREAGVRNLERELASACRKVARGVASGKATEVCVLADNLTEFLGQPKFRYNQMGEHDLIGKATGLVYTEFGGDITFVEVSLLPSSEGKILLTGHLGDVIKESAHTAFSYVRSQADVLGISPDFYRKWDVHVHFPSSATPKDGPSAGIAIATALVSALTARAVRRDVAMTGELSLHGKTLPIGGLKEKAIAAHRAGIRKVLIPEENRGELEEIPTIVREEIEFILASEMEEVLQHTLQPKP